MSRRSPSLRMMRCNRCLPRYLKSTTSIGQSSAAEQGRSKTSSFPPRINGNIETPFRRNCTERPAAISVSTQAKNKSLGICFIAKEGLTGQLGGCSIGQASQMIERHGREQLVDERTDVIVQRGIVSKLRRTGRMDGSIGL